ncbi:cupin domain-containing protein [Nocardia jiangsuensis]|uniref:Cupin domain-containing protein n=1 Tax=Nocardia jiangsuensis TaxID=1691563 RepID=A0ABV8DQE4_9NOCA
MRPLISALVAGSVVLLGAGNASATPGVDITAVTLGQVTVPAGIFPVATDLVARRITIGPGGSTGWHFHDGPVFGVIAAGELTHPGPDCVAPIYRAGSFINEPAGEWNTHVGQNLGSEPVVLYVVYAPPAGDPLFRDAPAPECA